MSNNARRYALKKTGSLRWRKAENLINGEIKQGANISIAQNADGSIWTTHLLAHCIRNGSAVSCGGWMIQHTSVLFLREEKQWCCCLETRPSNKARNPALSRTYSRRRASRLSGAGLFRVVSSTYLPLRRASTRSIESLGSSAPRYGKNLAGRFLAFVWIVNNSDASMAVQALIRGR